MNVHAHPGLPIRPDRLKDVLKRAAAIVEGQFREGARVTAKADGSPITDADVRSNDFLKDALLQLCPAAAWLSEESADDPSRLEKTWVWVVDPLDGTKEFASGIPEFAISVGLVSGDRVVAGGVVNPVTGEGAVGGIGIGLDCWGCERQQRQADSLASARASVSRTEMQDGTALGCLPLLGSTCTVGSVAYKLLRVALGVDDLTFSVQHKSIWDVCGGIALLEAVGKVYRRLDGEKLAFGGLSTRIRSGAAAGNRALVDEFILRARALL